MAEQMVSYPDGADSIVRISRGPVVGITRKDQAGQMETVLGLVSSLGKLRIQHEQGAQNARIIVERLLTGDRTEMVVPGRSLVDVLRRFADELEADLNADDDAEAERLRRILEG